MFSLDSGISSFPLDYWFYKIWEHLCWVYWFITVQVTRTCLISTATLATQDLYIFYLRVHLVSCIQKPDLLLCSWSHLRGNYPLVNFHRNDLRQVIPLYVLAPLLPPRSLVPLACLTLAVVSIMRNCVIDHEMKQPRYHFTCFIFLNWTLSELLNICRLLALLWKVSCWPFHIVFS